MCVCGCIYREPYSRPGVPLHWPYLAGKDGVSVCIRTSLSGNHGDSSRTDSVCPPRRWPGPSPTRVRFEDESETEAEIRYLERLRQRAGERPPALLVAKPHLSSFVNKTNEPTGAANGISTDRGCCPEGGAVWLRKPHGAQGSFRSGMSSHYKTRMPQDVLGRQCKSCGTLLTAEVTHHNFNPNPPPQNLHLYRTPPDPPVGPANGVADGVPCWVHSERIKETYIGTVVPAAKGDGDSVRRGSEDATTGSGGKACGFRISKMRVKRCSQKGERAGTHRPTVPVAPDDDRVSPPASTHATVALPPNPYALEQAVELPVLTPYLVSSVKEARTLGTPKSNPSSPLRIKSAFKSGLRSQCNGQQAARKALEVQERGVIASRQEGLCVEGGHGDVTEVCVSSEPTSCSVGMASCIDPAVPKHSSSPARTTGQHSDTAHLASG